MAMLCFACAGPSAEKKKPGGDSRALSTMTNAADISTYVGHIDEKAGTQYRMLAMHDYGQNDQSSGVVAVFTNTNRPLRVYLYPEGRGTDFSTETWIYLDSLSGKTVLLREMITSDKEVKENSFYFGQDTILHAETRAAANVSALEHAAFTPYVPSSPLTDSHLKPAQVDTLVQQVISAVRADRKDLSPAANEMRRQGASHWGTGNEPGWMLAVIPHQKIVFHTNYGQDKFEFPYADAQKGNDDATEFTTNENGHTLSVKFENKVCSDDADAVHPMTVTVKMDGKTFRGCGQSLY